MGWPWTNGFPRVGKKTLKEMLLTNGNKSACMCVCVGGSDGEADLILCSRLAAFRATQEEDKMSDLSSFFSIVAAT